MRTSTGLWVTGLMMAAGGAATPWQETCVMDQRIGFIVARRQGEESMATLCRHFGISRETGHKWWARYQAEGAAGLEDRSRAPQRNPRAIGEDVVEAVMTVRQRHPNWGPRKVKAWLEDRDPDRTWCSLGRLHSREPRAPVPARRPARPGCEGDPAASRPQRRCPARHLRL